MSEEHDKNTKEGKKRDVSPSTISQSSTGLEWDPSADVGTSDVRDDSPHSDHLLENLGAVGGIVNDLQSVHISRSRISRSRSYEDQGEEFPKNLAGFAHQCAINASLSLTNVSKDFIIDSNKADGWILKQLETPIGRKSRGLIDPISLKTKETFQFQTQDTRPMSSDSATTILPPPSLRGDNFKTTGSSSSPTNDLEGIDDQLPPDSQDSSLATYPNTKNGNLKRVPRSNQDCDLNRSQSMQELSYYGSATVPSGNSSKYTLSDRSNQIRTSRTGNIPELDGSQRSVSEWLEVGMTRSEIEYQKKKESRGSSSMIFVEINQNIDSKSMSKEPEQSKHSVAVQTTHRHKSKGRGIEGFSVSSDFSSILHSTPSDEYRFQDKENVPLRSQFPDQRNQSLKSQVRRRKSPSRPFVAASRKSSHQYHDAHHTRLNDNKHQYKNATTSSDKLADNDHSISIGENVSSIVRTSEDLSPLSSGYSVNSLQTALREMIHSERQAKKLIRQRILSPLEKKPPEEIVDAMTIRHQYHVKKVRTELEYLAKINKMLCQKLIQEGRYLKKMESKATARARRESKATSHRIEESNSTSHHSRKELKASSPSRIESKEASSMPLRTRNEHGVSSKATSPNRNESKTTKQKQIPKKLKPIKPSVAFYVSLDDANKIQPEPMSPIIMKTRTVRSHSHSDSESIIPRPRRSSVTINPVNAVPIDNVTKDQKLKLALKDVFLKRDPSFLAQMKERERMLAGIKLERKLRAEAKRDLIRQYGECSEAMDGLNRLPPKGPRLMTTKEMREITERNYKRLPEVREKVLKRRIDEEKRTNRIMSQIFAGKLQRAATKGRVNFVHSESLIRR